MFDVLSVCGIFGEGQLLSSTRCRRGVSLVVVIRNGVLSALLMFGNAKFRPGSSIGAGIPSEPINDITLGLVHGTEGRTEAGRAGGAIGERVGSKAHCRGRD